VTEQGIIRFLQDLGVQAHEVIAQKEDRIEVFIPFNSARKRACTAVRHPVKEDTVRVFVKGAPEMVIELCDRYFDANGNEQDLSSHKRQEVINNVVRDTFAVRAYRTILIAYTDMSIREYESLKNENNQFKSEKDREVLESSLTMVGIFGLQDPLRNEIIDSVKRCHTAGINVRMVTGDNLDTAKAIAIEAGIVSASAANEQYVCMEGKEFRELCGGLIRLDDPNGDGKLREDIGNKQMFRQIQAKLQVLARSTPEDKYMLVTGLKDLGNVVAVTGDGTNDAPALKKADVGFAMGITGTEVAKEASDIILLDDNFASIITAVKWGRNIYENVRKFLQFQLTVNVVAMFIVFLGGVALNDPPLTSVQMLWVNLIMDTGAALALATEPPSNDLLERKPYKRDEAIVTAIMWRNIVGMGLYQIIVLIVFLFFGKDIFGYNYKEEDPFFLNVAPYTANVDKLTHFTMIFNSFVFMQVFNAINSRKLGEHDYNPFSGFFNNGLFILIQIFTVGVQILLVEYGSSAARTISLTWT
jgi:P-type Ca2+ transporter type 2B